MHIPQKIILENEELLMMRRIIILLIVSLVLIEDGVSIQSVNADKSVSARANSVSAISQETQKDRIIKERSSLFSKGLEADKNGNYQEAFNCYKSALELSRKSGDKNLIVSDLRRLAGLFMRWGEYNKAINAYEEQKEIYEKMIARQGMEASSAKTMLNETLAFIVQCYMFSGQVNKAADRLEEYLKLHSSPTLLRQAGVFYYWTNDYEKAIEYFEIALDSAKKNGKGFQIIQINTYLQEIYQKLGQFDKSIKYAEDSLSLKNKDWCELELNNLARAYHAAGQYNKAIKYLNEALAIYKKKQVDEAGIAMTLDNMGIVYYSLGKKDRAEEICEEAISIYLKMQDTRYIIDWLVGVASQYIEQGHLYPAIRYLRVSIDIIEKHRKAATGKTKRDYLSSQINSYKLLISAYVQNNDLQSAFEIMEHSRARLLAERLGTSISGVNIRTAPIIQNGMKNQSAVLAYSISPPWAICQPGWVPTCITLTKGNIHATKIFANSILQSTLVKHNSAIQSALRNQRGIKVSTTSFGRQGQKKVRGKDILENLINFYRKLLTTPSTSNDKAVREIGRTLYTLLIKPLIKNIEDKKKLIVVPDGVLAFIPFETLIDDEGKYLIENYDIVYAPSMSVIELLKNRKYGGRRKALLSIG
ncbi:tetratricopeptide repeat protein, partial [Thermodesulfobacteriota bacterium]